MSDVEYESLGTPEMDYDMWDGQFEFIGPSPNQPTYGFLKPPPHLQPTTNGVKKNAAHAWCEEVTDQVITCIILGQLISIFIVCLHCKFKLFLDNAESHYLLLRYRPT